jgi:hypothetical protein
VTPTRLDVEGGFDYHDYRTKLKLRRDDGETTVLSNRDGCLCPACDRTFERLLVSEADSISFNSAPNGPICLVRTGGQLLVLTH